MITHETIPQYYDWLSRYVQLANWLQYRDRFAGLTMHKTLAAPSGGGDVAGLSYANDHLLDVALPSLGPGRRVLDAGCGFGGTVFHWHRRAGGTYDGLTLSRVQCSVAQTQARRRGVAEDCRFHLRSYDAPLDGPYDVIVAIESLIHAPGLSRTIKNLAGALRPEGMLLVLDDMAEVRLDDTRAREATLLRLHWGCDPYPRAADYRGAIESSGLSLVGDEDLSPLMRPRPPDVLDEAERRYTSLYRWLPLPPARSVVSAYLGGIALERLHRNGDVRYRLLVGRNDSVKGTA